MRIILLSLFISSLSFADVDVNHKTVQCHITPVNGGTFASFSEVGLSKSASAAEEEFRITIEMSPDYREICGLTDVADDQIQVNCEEVAASPKQEI